MNNKKVKKKNKLNDWERTLITMDQIKSGKIKQLTTEERDELDKKCQIGKYRPWQVDPKRIKELEKKTQEELSAIMIKAQSNRIQVSRRTYSTKKNNRSEIERIKSEIENG